MTEPEISSVSPFFIVHDGVAALSFYRDQLGFNITYREPADDPFFGIVRRGGAMIMLKSVGVAPLPNYKREPAARWEDRKSTRLNSSHLVISYAVFCLKKKKKKIYILTTQRENEVHT